MSEPVTVLGPYRQGEIPEPLLATFRSASGQPLDLTGYEARWIMEFPDGTSATRTATLLAQTGATKGQVEYEWDPADLTQRGDYRAEMWVGNSTNRFASIKYVWAAYPAIAVPVI